MDVTLEDLVRDELFQGKDGTTVYTDEAFWVRLLKIAIEKARDHEFTTD